MNINDLPPRYRKQAEEQLNKKNNTASASSNVEPPISNAPVAKKKDERHDTPCHIHIHSVRKRLADADGVSGKAAIDGIVQAGILQDDSPEYVKEVSYSQEKTKGDEYTIIEVFSVDDDENNQNELNL